jgi:hypothetical protein
MGTANIRNVQDAPPQRKRDAHLRDDVCYERAKEEKDPKHFLAASFLSGLLFTVPLDSAPDALFQTILGLKSQ